MVKEWQAVWYLWKSLVSSLRILAVQNRRAAVLNDSHALAALAEWSIKNDLLFFNRLYEHVLRPVHVFQVAIEYPNEAYGCFLHSFYSIPVHVIVSWVKIFWVRFTYSYVFHMRHESHQRIPQASLRHTSQIFTTSAWIFHDLITTRVSIAICILFLMRALNFLNMFKKKGSWLVKTGTDLARWQCRLGRNERDRSAQHHCRRPRHQGADSIQVCMHLNISRHLSICRIYSHMPTLRMKTT